MAVTGPGVESHPSAAGLVGHSSLEKFSLMAILVAILLVCDAVECTVELVGEIERLLVWMCWHHWLYLQTG